MVSHKKRSKPKKSVDVKAKIESLKREHNKALMSVLE